MSERAHSHVSIMTNPIEDAELVLNLSRSPNKKSKSPCRSTISNWENLEITNDDQITLGNTHSARLKSLSRIIASESERILCNHALMTIACQFCVVKWKKETQ